MIPKYLIDALMDPQPAKITAETKADGIINVKFDGRAIEILCMSLSIAEQLIEESNGLLTVDEYCNMLKDSVNERGSVSKEQRDVEMEIMKKIFESVFK